MYRYRSTLQIGSGPVTTANPVWGDDAAIESSRSDGTAFFRDSLGGQFLFMGDDARAIIDSDIEDEIVFVLSWWNGATWEVENTSVFTKTDCDISDNPGDVSVEPEFRTRDRYEKVLAGMDREFDLIELAPAITEVLYTRQALFQFYENNSPVLTSVLSGVYFEESVTPETSGTTLITDYFFGILGHYAAVIYDPDNLPDPDVSGSYSNETALLSGQFRRIGDGAYRIQANDLGSGNFQFVMVRVSDLVTVYEAGVNETLDVAVFASLTSASTVTVYASVWYCRLLTNLEELPDTTPTNPINDPDLSADTGVYTRALGIGGGSDGFGNNVWGSAYESQIVATAAATPVPTPYGKFPSTATYSAGNYYPRPNASAIPLQRGVWENVSFWFTFNAVFRTFQETAGEEIRLRNAYRLGDCIQTVLAAIDPDLTHSEGDDDYSDFLYGASNPLRGNALTALITPKSNILNPEYSVPARKARIRLSDLLGLCWSFYKVQWHIQDEFEIVKFILEQIQYYENGRSYTVEVVGTDLTTAIEGKTARTWARDTNAYKYNKAKIPDRIEMTWMDESTKPFRGVPISIRSRYAEPGNIDQINLSPFSADVDYALLRSQDFSTDGFFFLEAEIDGSDYRLPFVEVVVDGETFNVQNGYASIAYAQEQYHVKVMPAAAVTINGVDVAADSVKRNRVQELDFPATDPDLMELVVTAAGTGRPVSAVKNLESRTLKIEIEHDTV